MASKLVECVPNFSEARRAEVIDQIVDSISAFSGILILDRHSDLDHNRTVLTFVGDPVAVEKAAFAGIATAARLIDLNQHQGEHPRIGAADVVPFIPISEMTMVECIEMARRLGKRVAEELDIPVYFYEEAAQRQDRRNLEDIRRGEFEGLKELIGSDPYRAPDLGPARLGPAGATVIGAREALIAYNLYLTTSDVSIAEKISRRVRNSSGGFHYVKAIGVLVNGMAQVSMNLTNFHRSPMAQVTEMVRREAQRYGVGIHHGEIVGLLPNQALVNAARYYLQLDAFDNDQVLESRLFNLPASQAQPEKAVSADFLDLVAEGTPAPGGGSAGAHTAALASALVVMVARLTVGKPKYAAVESECWQVIERGEALRAELTHAVDLDADAFDQILQARRLPKETPAQQENRNAALHASNLHAAEVPLETAHKSLEVLRLAVRMVQIGNINAISDAASGGHLAKAALDAAGLNVRINLLSLEDDIEALSMLDQMKAFTLESDQLLKELEEALKSRSGL